MSRHLVTRANTAVLGVLVAILLLVGGATWERFMAAREARAWSEHTTQVLTALKDLAIAARDAETGHRGFLLTGSDDCLAPYRAGLGEVTLLSGEIQRLTADNPAQQGRLRDLAPVLQRKPEELAQTVQLRRDVGFEAATRIVRTDVGRDLMQRIETTVGRMTAEEQALLARRQTEVDSHGTLVRWSGSRRAP